MKYFRDIKAYMKDLVHYKVVFEILLSFNSVATFVSSGQLTHTSPENTPQVFADIMTSCWAFTPIERPEMKAILEKVEALEQI